MKFKEGVHMKGGVITERNSDLCTIRVRIPAGNITPAQMKGIADIAEKYESGFIHLTTRQTTEIPHIKPKFLEEIAEDLKNNGTPLGSERDEIVNIIACPGVERCKYANINTMTLASKIDAKVFGKEMPVKIRIAISGCPNACTSPLLNEIGIIGRNEPIRTPGLCSGCGTCVQYCKEDAIIIKNGISVLIPEKCVQCGTCVQSCHFNLMKSEHHHYLITVGGRRGRHPHLGRELVRADNEEEVILIIEKIINWIYRRAWSGRFLSDQLDDIQFESFKNEIITTFSQNKIEY